MDWHAVGRSAPSGAYAIHEDRLKIIGKTMALSRAVA